MIALIPRFHVHPAPSGSRRFVLEMDFGDPKLPTAHTEIHPTEAFAFEMAAAEAQAILDFLRENSHIFSSSKTPITYVDVPLAVVRGRAKTFDVVNMRHPRQPLVRGLGSQAIAESVVNSIQRAVYVFRHYNAFWGSHERPSPTQWPSRG